MTIERQSLKADAPEIAIIGPTGAVSRTRLKAAEPGLSRATIDVDRLGLYRVSDGEHQALVNVGPDNPLEFQEVVSTTEKLRPIAEATGGTVRRIAHAAGEGIVMPRIIAMHESPSYGGADYLGVKRTGSSVVVGRRHDAARRSVSSAWLALLGAIILVWRREGSAGRRP